MNTLSLFDGISCGRVALDRIGITPNRYYAAEIDKYAVTISRANWPDIVHVGDVTNWVNWDIDWSSIDLIFAGFPCQAWSVAGKQLGDKDERGMLFWTMLDIMKHVKFFNPDVKFVIENVKMKKEFEQYITYHTTQALGEVHKTLINSALVSAQNRNRYYWTNAPIPQPEDKGVVLADVLEHEGSGWIKNHGEWKPRNEKSQCIDANYHKGVDNHGQRTMVVMSYNRNAGLINELDKAYPLNASDWRGLNRNQNQNAVTDGISYRKLTPIECERLQNLPDGYTEVIESHSYSLYNYKETDNKEDLYLCDVKLVGAREKQKQKSMVTYVLCTTSDSLGTELLSCQKLSFVKTYNANIAIEKLERREVGLEECVIDITKTGSDMVTLYTQIKSSLNLGQGVTKSALVVRTSTGKLLRIVSVESCQEMRLFTTLIAIKLITQLKICTYVTDRVSIHYCIDSLKESQGSLLSVDLSSLKMETTKQTVSNTQRYKCLGNGWTVDVISHILNHLTL